MKLYIDYSDQERYKGYVIYDIVGRFAVLLDANIAAHNLFSAMKKLDIEYSHPVDAVKYVIVDRYHNMDKFDDYETLNIIDKRGEIYEKKNLFTIKE